MASFSPWRNPRTNCLETCCNTNLGCSRVRTGAPSRRAISLFLFSAICALVVFGLSSFNNDIDCCFLLSTFPREQRAGFLGTATCARFVYRPRVSQDGIPPPVLSFPRLSSFSSASPPWHSLDFDPPACDTLPLSSPSSLSSLSVSSPSCYLLT